VVVETEVGSGLWQTIVKKKYLQGDTVGSVKHKLDDSPVWSDLLKIKHIYLKGRAMLVRNGRKPSLWTHCWLNDKPLCAVAPTLFDICCDKNISVYHFLTKQGQLNFKRWLTPILFYQWLGVVNEIYMHNFQNNEDIPRWRWNKNNCFSTKSVYDFLNKDNSGNRFKHVWKAKIPYKIKIFMWLVENNAVLTKGNLLKRHWVGSPTCHFCFENESIDHLFFQCPVAKTTWGTIGTCIGTTTIPRNLQQYFSWITQNLPGGTAIYTCACAAVC